MSEKSFRTCSREETIALGERLGRLLVPGDVLVLTGDLGAGKTQLTKGIAEGMGVTDDVTSPTFTIEMVYEGSDMPLYHATEAFAQRRLIPVLAGWRRRHASCFVCATESAWTKRRIRVFVEWLAERERQTLARLREDNAQFYI